MDNGIGAGRSSGGFNMPQIQRLGLFLAVCNSIDTPAARHMWTDFLSIAYLIHHNLPLPRSFSIALIDPM